MELGQVWVELGRVWGAGKGVKRTKPILCIANMNCTYTYICLLTSKSIVTNGIFDKPDLKVENGYIILYVLEPAWLYKPCSDACYQPYMGT